MRQMQLQPALSGVAEEHALLCQSNFRPVGIRDLGEKNSLPAWMSAADGVPDVKHKIRKPFFKHPRLQFRRDLAQADLRLLLDAQPVRQRREIRRTINRDGASQHREAPNRKEKLAHADACGSHGSNFIVARHPAEADQDSHQHCHRNREAQQGGEAQQRQEEDLLPQAGVAQCQLQQLRGAPQKQDKGE